MVYIMNNIILQLLSATRDNKRYITLCVVSIIDKIDIAKVFKVLAWVCLAGLIRVVVFISYCRWYLLHIVYS